MNRQDIQSEIQNIIAQLSNDDLQDVKAYLKKFKKEDSPKFDLTKNLEQIINEDYNLLKRLAQ